MWENLEDLVKWIRGLGWIATQFSMYNMYGDIRYSSTSQRGRIRRTYQWCYTSESVLHIVFLVLTLKQQDIIDTIWVG